jgi:hypothetical protein
MSIDGIEWDAPDTPENVAAFGYTGSADNPSPFPKVRMVTVAECGSHAVVAAVIGSQWQAEQHLAAGLYPGLGGDWLLLADRGFYSFTAWNAARAGGTHLLWRVKADLRLPLIEALPDGSYLSVLMDAKIRGKTRDALLEAARAGEDLDPARAVLVRVVEYTVTDRTGDGKDELIALITTIGDPAAAPAQVLAQTYHDRWETRNRQRPAQNPSTRPGTGPAVQKPGPDPPGDLRLPAHPLRDQRPDLPGRDRHRHRPDRVKFLRTVRIIRRRVTDSAAFPPERQAAILATIMTGITAKRNLNPARRDRTYPRVVKRNRHNSYRIKRRTDHGTRHHGPATIHLANQPPPTLAA